MVSRIFRRPRIIWSTGYTVRGTIRGRTTRECGIYGTVTRIRFSSENSFFFVILKNQRGKISSDASELVVEFEERFAVVDSMRKYVSSGNIKERTREDGCRFECTWSLGDFSRLYLGRIIEESKLKVKNGKLKRFARLLEREKCLRI